MSFDSRDLETQHGELLPARETLLLSDLLGAAGLAAVNAGVGDTADVGDTANDLLDVGSVANNLDALNDVADVNVSLGE